MRKRKRTISPDELAITKMLAQANPKDITDIIERFLNMLKEL